MATWNKQAVNLLKKSQLVGAMVYIESVSSYVKSPLKVNPHMSKT